MKRRPFIATLGASAIAGCGGVFGGGRAERATRTSQPFRPVREPTAWPAPHYDGGHTRHSPDRAGVRLAEEWRYEESRSGFLRTYDIETGRRRNERPLREPCFIPPVVAGDRVFTVTTRGVTAYS